MMISGITHVITAAVAQYGLPRSIIPILKPMKM